MPVSQHVIPVHSMGIPQKLPLGEIKVTVNETVHAKAAPDGIAKGNRPAVCTAGRIVDGVFQKVIHRDGTILNQVGGKFVQSHSNHIYRSESIG